MNYKVKIRKSEEELFNFHNSYLNNKILAKLTANRHIPYKLPSKKDNLISPFKFKDMQKALEIFLKFLEKNPDEIIVNYDYDNDGFSGALIFLSFIKEKYGILLDSYVNKKREGYDLTPEIVERFFNNGKHLIITIDKGIGSYEGIKKAKELGMQVIILDHHLPKYDYDNNVLIPPADAIIDHTLEDFYKEENTVEICGAATAWYFCRAIDEKIASKYVDIAGIATIVDMVSLKSKENRIIVLKALDNIKKGKFSILSYERFFQLSLLENKSIDDINEYDFAFVLGPTINSLCRYDKNSFYLDKMLNNTLTDEDIFEMIRLNNVRKEEVQNLISLIENKIEIFDDFAFFKGGENTPEYLLGLIASKFSSAFKKTVFIMKEENGIIRGSGRSINYDLQELFSKKYKTEIKGGGHRNAVGFSFSSEEWKTFLNDMFNNIKEETVFYVDGIIKDINKFNLSMYNLFKKLEPFGIGFEKPAFLIELEKENIQSFHLIKDIHLKLMYRNKEFVKFFVSDKVDLSKLDKYYFIVSLEKNTFRNKEKEQFFIIDILPKEKTKIIENYN